MTIQDLTNLIHLFPIDEYLTSHNINFIDKSRYLMLEYCINPDCRRSRKFIINRQDKYFRCFVCDYHGNLAHFISLLDNISKYQAFEIIKNQTIFTQNTTLAPLALSNKISTLDELAFQNDTISIPFYFTRIDLKDGSDVSNYLKNVRGYTQELVDLFDLYYHDYAKRVIFPIKDHLGRFIGWQGRDITGESQIKILTKPDGLKKSLFLYNFCTVKDESTITLVEGPIDCHKAYQHNAVALFGKQISDIQLSLLMSNENLQTVILGLDPDARKECLALAAQLSLLYDVKIVDLPLDKDLGDCSIDEANNYITSSIQYNVTHRALTSSLSCSYL